MITAVSMNPSIDLTLFISNLTIGASHRTGHTRRDISGKAANVVYALRNLGLPCQLLGFDFVENGNLLKDSLAAVGAPHDMVAVQGSIRTNVKIFEESSQIMTEVNQEGASVPEEAVSVLLDKVIKAQSDVLILSGSLPSGVDDGIYGEIIRNVKAPVILDAHGPALYKGLVEGPYIIKPNLTEMEQAFGVSLPSKSVRISTGQALIRKYSGLRAICLSLGKDGALMIGRDEAFYAPALDIAVRGVQGAGDSMVAGLAAELSADVDAPLDVLLRSAMAAAAASLVLEGTLMGQKEDYDKMLEKVEIIKWRH